MGLWLQLIGTVSDTFRIGFNKAVVDSTALSTERVYDLPNKSGTFALLDDVSEVDWSHVIKRETPAGDTDGVNTTYTLAHTPIAGTVEGFLNSGLIYEGVGEDYTISGDTITMLSAPLDGDKIRFSYIF